MNAEMVFVAGAVNRSICFQRLTHFKGSGIFVWFHLHCDRWISLNENGKLNPFEPFHRIGLVMVSLRKYIVNSLFMCR